MNTITFFRQMRRDGGIRTGVDVGTETVLSRFESGTNERDPSIVWYVDVRAEGKGVPNSPPAARQWFAAQADPVRKLLEKLAASFPAGVDAGDVPFEHRANVSGPKGQKISLSVVSAVTRRAEGVGFSKILKDVAENWDGYVSGLIAA